MLVIYIDFLARHSTGQRGQPVLIAEAVIGLALLNQLFRILQINALRLALTLYIGADPAVLVRSFIMLQARCV